jgi:hypothetical protein
MKLVKCSPHQDDVQNPCFNLAGSRSRVVFKGLNHVFRVRSVTSKPLEGISCNFGLVMCSHNQGDVQKLYPNLVSLRSPVVFKSLNHVRISCPPNNF